MLKEKLEKLKLGASLIIAKLSYQEPLQVMSLAPEQAKDKAMLKNTYFKLSKQNHPDLGGSTEKMQHINEAYHLLEKGDDSSGYRFYQYQPKDNSSVQAEQAELDKLKPELTKAIMSVFPHSYLKLYYGRYGGVNLYINFGIYHQDECAHNIFENNICIVRLSIERNKDGKFVLSANQHILIKAKPEPNTYYAMSHIKVPFRKTTGDDAKVVAAVKKTFVNVKKAIEDNWDKLFDDDKMKMKGKI